MRRVEDTQEFSQRSLAAESPGRPSALALLDRPLQRTWNGNGEHLDAFVAECLPLLGRGLAADAALVAFAVVDAARFLGETLTDVFGVGEHVAHGPQPSGLQVC